MYRLSSYTIFTQLETVENKYMLVHGYTGAIDIVAERVVQYLKNNAECIYELNNAIEQQTFKTLVARGYITEKSKRDEVAYVNRFADILHRVHKTLYKHFLFIVTYNCNFRCPYCYENSISTCGKNWSGKTFTKELIDRAYSALLEIEPSRKLHDNTITLYGGEPLLRENLNIIEYIVNKGSELGYVFSAITNGYDLNCFSHLFSPKLIKSVQITLDGNEELHNKRRIHYSVGNTFEKIIENIKIALDAGIYVVIRINTDIENIDKINDLKCIFNERGFMDNSKFSFYSIPLLNYEQFENKSSHFKYINNQEFNKIQKVNDYEFGCYDRGLVHNLINAISNKKLVDFKSIYCAAQSGEFLLDPYGDIYPCWDVVGIKEHIIGHYTNEKIEWTQVKELWHNRNVATLSNCKQCKFALLCQGGCAGNAWRHNGSIQTHECDEYVNIFRMSVNRVYKTLEKQIN